MLSTNGKGVSGEEAKSSIRADVEFLLGNDELQRWCWFQVTDRVKLGIVLQKAKTNYLD